MSTYYLVSIFPALRKVRFPFVRDQVMLLMIAVNQFLLGVETYLAHSISETIVPGEWIPIIFGPIAGVLLLVAGWIAIRRRMAANFLGSLVFLLSIGVGLLGSYFHLTRAFLPNAQAGQQVSLPLLIWAPPLLGPITFALIGILGLSAAWQEDPPGSGRLVLPGRLTLQLPYSKTRAYFFMIGLGALITTISSVLDHSRSSFSNNLVWIPTVFGLFATTVILTLGFIKQPNSGDLIIYTISMLLMVAVGVLGSTLHVLKDMPVQGVLVTERLIRDAPVMAPMLFANMGALGLIILLNGSNDPKDLPE